MPVAPRPLRRRGALLAVGLLALAGPALAGCGDDDSSSDPGESGTTEAASETTAGSTAPADDDGGEGTGSTEAAAEGLSILVTNDDGYDAEGIDVLVEALVAAGHEVEVVAPAEQQSGTGGTFTEGAVEASEEQTASGQDAIAVNGFPSDSVRVAIDELGMTPDVVVSGINEGQNVGPIVDASGTIGAARAAVARDIPALALSAGLVPGGAEPVEPSAYERGAELAVEWLAEHQEALASGSADLAVTSINIPSCTTGEVRDLVEVPVATQGDPLAGQDCTSTAEDPADDIAGLTAGFATLSVVPDEPATPPQPG